MWIKGLFGGRLHSYEVVLDYGRREVLLRLKRQANDLGCSSIQNIRIETSMVAFAKNNKSKQAKELKQNQAGKNKKAKKQTTLPLKAVAWLDE